MQIAVRLPPIAAAKASQASVVIFAAAALFIGFATLRPGFLTAENMLSLIRNVSVLGILALGMALVVIGRGIDLCLVSTMVMSSAYFLVVYGATGSLATALAAGGFLALAVGLIQGWLIAYAEVPAIFTTLAMGVALQGFGQYFLISADVVQLPIGDHTLHSWGNARIGGVPGLVVLFIALALSMHLGLRGTKPGLFVYATGDNPSAARITGVPIRRVLFASYVIAALIAFVSGIATVATVSSMSLRIANSTMIYDVILVVVLGGIGLSGGKGGVANVLAGTLLVGTLLNGMTLLDVSYTTQSIVKGCILLLAILIDTRLNPRDEQTVKQGDI